MPSLNDTAYPRLKSNPSPDALRLLYTPTEEELSLAQKVTRASISQLGFLVLLKTFQTVGYPVQVSQVPEGLILHIAAAVNLDLSPASLDRYDASGSRRRHLSVIRDYLQIQAFTPVARQVMIAAMEEAVQTQHDLVDLINIALEELVRQRYELPGFTVMVRQARDIRAASNEALFHRVFQALEPPDRMQLRELFYRAQGQLATSWNEIKQEPGQPTITEFKALVTRLQWLKPLQVNSSALALIPETKWLHCAAEAMALDANQMKELPEAKRATLAAALLRQRYSQTLDDIAEMFIKRLQRMHHKAKDALEQYRRESQQRIDELISTFRDTLVAHRREGEVPERFAAVDEVIGERSQELVEQCDAHLAFSGNNYLPFLPQFYRSHRSALFQFVEVVPLDATTQDKTLLLALQFIRRHQGQRKTWLDLPGVETGAEAGKETQVEVTEPALDLSWIPAKWWTLVTGEKSRKTTPKQVHRQYLELCVFSHILLELKSGDLYIEGSSAFGDYYRQLLSPKEVEAMLPGYAQQVGLPVEGPVFAQHVKAWLAKTIQETDASFPANSRVVFRKERLVIRREKPQLPKGAAQLKQLIDARVKPVNLLDILVDTELWLQWSRYFKPLSGHEAKLQDPVARYLATTFCYGCNIGPSQLAQSLSLFGRRQLARVNQRHITPEALQRAIESIINDYNQFHLPKLWGTGGSASVDGTKWDIYENNLLAEHHIRYGGYGGIAYYHVSDTYIALFSHFIPCGVFEALYLFDGLLNNHSEIQPDTLHGDTHAQSLTVFGLAYLLGIKLMPRIRNWKELKFYKADDSYSYEQLDSLFSETVDWSLISMHLPDMLRVVLSIKAGKISASTILRKLGTNSRKNKLFKAFQALGAAVRTGFLMQYINDVQLRSTIQAATNKSESFNSFVQWLAFGNDGRLKTNDREELRKRIKYNHLVANCVILYNVSQMSCILNELVQEGHALQSDALAGTSPFIRNHIVRLGQYSLDLNRQPPAIQYQLPIISPAEQPDSSS